MTTSALALSPTIVVIGESEALGLVLTLSHTPAPLNIRRHASRGSRCLLQSPTRALLPGLHSPSRRSHSGRNNPPNSRPRGTTPPQTTGVGHCQPPSPIRAGPRPPRLAAPAWQKVPHCRVRLVHAPAAAAPRVAARPAGGEPRREPRRRRACVRRTKPARHRSCRPSTAPMQRPTATPAHWRSSPPLPVTTRRRLPRARTALQPKPTGASPNPPSPV